MHRPHNAYDSWEYADQPYQSQKARVEIHETMHFINKNALCYEQTSPLDVPVYAFGDPKPTALAQFVHSALFFSSPQKKV